MATRASLDYPQCSPHSPAEVSLLLCSVREYGRVCDAGKNRSERILTDLYFLSPPEYEKVFLVSCVCVYSPLVCLDIFTFPLQGFIRRRSASHEYFQLSCKNRRQTTLTLKHKMVVLAKIFFHDFQHFSRIHDRLCGLVVRIPAYSSRVPGFDSRHYQIF
jgi:hypothetical protein